MSKKRSLMAALAGSILASGLPVYAQTNGCDNTLTTNTHELIQTIEADPNRLPETATPSPTQPFRCGPHRVFSVDWHPDLDQIAVGIGSGMGEVDCPFLGTMQIFDTSHRSLRTSTNFL